jgi:integrase
LKDEHKTDGHPFEQDKNPQVWHGWHAFRRGRATTLHALGVDDIEIQRILRHSNIGITHKMHIQSVTESQVNAMELVGEEFEKSSLN